MGIRGLDRLALAAGRVGDVGGARCALGGDGAAGVARQCRCARRRTGARPTATPARQLSEKPGFEGLDFADYVAAVDDVDGSFDLVVVDGRARNACFHRAITRLAPGGVLVFDNVDRRRYRDAIASSPVAVDVEWTRGLTPALPYPTRTALVRLRD